MYSCRRLFKSESVLIKLIVKNQHFINKLLKLVTYNPNTNFIVLCGYLYKTINSSAASINNSTSDMFERFSI